ncbi:MAG TPA: hypothetical protein HA306_06900 [Methanosarcina sp.]|nr:hypothetical protein [Methanosarcina sp.]
MPVKRVFFLLLLAAVLTASGCIDDEDGTKMSISGNDTEINISLSDPAEGSWCPAGSQVQVKNPTTGKALNMTIAGTENFENETFCRAVIETGSEENTSRFEYMWSQDKNTTVWTKYDENGNMSLRYVHRK